MTSTNVDDPISPDRGGVPRGKDQQCAIDGSREGWQSTVSELERSGVSSRRGPTNPRPQLKPHVEVVGDGEDVHPRIGGARGT